MKKYCQSRRKDHQTMRASNCTHEYGNGIKELRVMKKYFQSRRKDHQPNGCWRKRFLLGLRDGMNVDLLNSFLLCSLDGVRLGLLDGLLLVHQL